jgi:hypothetical protein
MAGFSVILVLMELNARCTEGPVQELSLKYCIALSLVLLERHTAAIVL